MVSFSFLILSLVAVAILGLSVLHYWKLNNKARTDCIATAIKTQTRITNNINFLLSLNPKARKLHIQNRIWKIRLAAAIAARNPIAANRARTKIAYYKSELASLDRLQNATIKSTNLYFQSWRTNPNQGGARRLNVERSSDGVAPQYSLEGNPTDEHVIWKHGKTKPNPLLSKFFKVNPALNWKWRCGASIEERNEQWKPRLIEAKSYWNSAFLS